MLFGPRIFRNAGMTIAGVILRDGLSLCFGRYPVGLDLSDDTTSVRRLLRLGPYMLVLATWDPEDPR